MACNNTKFVGKDVVMEYSIGCGDALPAGGDWKVFGSLRTKSFNLSWDTVDATDGDSVGALRENLATFQTLSISGDGVVKKAGTGYANMVELMKHFVKPDATDGQPVVWIRMTFPDLTFTAYMLLSNFSREATYDDVVTYSFEATATASDFGLIAADTVVATGVTALPETIAIDVGDYSGIVATVAPAGANQAVTFKSSAVGVATVTENGVVKGIAAGTATITVTSKSDPTLTDTVAVTVSA